MKCQMQASKLFNVLAVSIGLTFVYSTSAFAVDADAALSLARQNGCLKCHAVDKHKDGCF